jgi:hypothetical protein
MHESPYETLTTASHGEWVEELFELVEQGLLRVEPSPAGPRLALTERGEAELAAGSER